MLEGNQYVSTKVVVKPSTITYHDPHNPCMCCARLGGTKCFVTLNQEAMAIFGDVQSSIVCYVWESFCVANNVDASTFTTVHKPFTNASNLQPIVYGANNYCSAHTSCRRGGASETRRISYTATTSGVGCVPQELHNGE